MEERGTRVGNDTPALVAAVRDGDLGLVMHLVQQGHSLHDTDKDGATALYWACSRGHTNICDFLLNAGSDVNARVKWGATPLLAAADNGQEICISQLLRKQADVNAANNRGDTPLHAAAYRGYLSILCMLMAAGANPFLKNSASMTPLQEAFVQRNEACVTRLQQYMHDPGFSGPISLPIPSPASVSSYSDSLDESYKTWPYVPTPSRPRSSQGEQPALSNSLRSPKVDSFSKNNTNSLNYDDRATSFSQYGHSELPKSAIQNCMTHNTESVDSLSHFKDISQSTISELTANGESGILSFDSLLRNTVSIPSKSGCQVQYTSRNSSPSSLSKDMNHEVKSETPRMENAQNYTQHETNQKIETPPKLLPRERTANHNFAEKEHNIPQSVASNTRLLSHLNRICVPEKKSGKVKHVPNQIMPGVNVSEFVEILQVKIIELQEKVIQSNTTIAHLRDQLSDVHSENEDLKADNLLLRNLLHQHETSSGLITRTTWESSECEKYTISPPELPHSVASFVERNRFERHVDSRQAIENSESEDNSS